MDKCRFCNRTLMISFPNFCPYCGKDISITHKIAYTPIKIANYSILSYFYDDVKIAADQNAARLCKNGDSISFRHEPENPYDENAIVVERIASSRKQKLGYLHKGRFQEMVIDFLKRDDDVSGHILQHDISENIIVISLEFYKKFDDTIVEKYFTIKLSEKKYDSLVEDGEMFATGYEISIEHDEIEDRYMIESWAKLPQRLNVYAESDDYLFYLDDDEINDDDSHTLKIGVIERKV